MLNIWRRLFVIGIALAAACVGAGDDASLSRAGRDAAFDRIDRRLGITVTPVRSDQSVGDPLVDIPVLEFEPYSLMTILQSHCGDDSLPCGADGECQDDICELQRALCIAHAAIRLVESPAPTTFETPANWTEESEFSHVVIAAQDAESVYLMARLAVMASRFALDQAGRAWHDGDSCGSDLTQESNLQPEDASVPLTAASYLAISYVEAMHLQERAIGHAVRSGRAVADANFAEEPARSDAVAARFLHPVLGTFAIGGLIVGGDGGGDGFGDLVAEVGMCSTEALGAGAAEALRLLRTAAPPPTVVTAIPGVTDGTAVDLDAFLITGWVGAATALDVPGEVDTDAVCVSNDDSVRCRLANMLGAPDLASLSTAEALASALGVTANDFALARQRMADEILAYDRSRRHLLPGVLLHDHLMSSDLFDRYAGTGTAPVPAPSAYYAAVAAYTSTPSGGEFFEPVMGDEYPLAPNPSYAGYSEPNEDEDFADMTDGAIEGLREMLGEIFVGDPPTALEDPDLAAARDILLGELTAGGVRVNGRLSACLLTDGSLEDSYIHVRVYLPDAIDPEHLLAVSGRAGLECATLGAIDGVPCTAAHLAELTPIGATLSSQEWSAGALYAGEGEAPDFPEQYHTVLNAGAFVAERNGPRDDAALFFVVRMRAGLEEVEAGPGTYDALAGFEMRVVGDDNGDYAVRAEHAYQYCVQAPAVPAIQDMARDLLAPSSDDCAESLVNCAGLPSDLRIPLENELTDDGDQVESSWRHYLALARAAADEADALGQDLIRTGLAMDQRAEEAISSMEQICGVPIEIDRLPPRTTGACAMNACATEGYECDLMSNQCVLDPVAFALAHTDSANQTRLAQCLGDGTVGYAGLGGDGHVCLWDYGDPSSACRGAASGECPYRTAQGVACNPPPMGAFSRRIDGVGDTNGTPPSMMDPPAPTEALLDLFHQPSEEDTGATRTGVDDADVPAACAALATWRTGDGPTRPGFIWGEPFRTSRLAELGAALSWAAFPGDYSRVYVDGNEVISTGGLMQGPSPETPEGWMIESPFGPRCPGWDAMEPPTASDIATDIEGPLFCFGGIEGSREARARMNDMLARAVMAARLVTGNSLEGLRVPYYGRYPNADIHVLPGQTWVDLGEIDGESGGYLEHAIGGGVGATGTETDGNGSSTLEALRGEMYRIGPQDADTEWGIEWTRCPYDAVACTEIYDDAHDTDDLSLAGGHVIDWDRDMPFIVRRLSGQVGGTHPSDFFHTAWTHESDATGTSSFGVPFHRLIMEAVLAARDGRGESLAIDPTASHTRGLLEGEPLVAGTRYWRRAVHYLNYASGSSHGVRYGDLLRENMHATGLEPRSDGGGSGSTLGCGWRTDAFDSYFYCVRTLGGVDYNDTFDGNRAFIAQRGLTNRDVMNGLELLCYAAERQAGGGNYCGVDPPEIVTMADALQASGYLRCQAANIRENAATSVIVNLPQRVVEAVQASGPTLAGQDEGEFGAEVDEVRGALEQLSIAEGGIAGTVESMANEIEELNSAVLRSGYQSRIEELQMTSAIVDRMLGCASALAQIPGTSVEAIGRAANAAVVCANSIVQSSLRAQIAELDQGLIDETLVERFSLFDEHVNSLNQTLMTQSANLSSALESISAALARVRVQQANARRALARALLLDSAEAAEVLSINAAMRAEYNTALTRYTAAHEHAVELAWIARMATEQRLGMNLRSMSDDLVTVEAPSEWADELCRLPSIDYDAISAGVPGPTGERGGDLVSFATPDGYSGAYIGDYVDRLEQVFESYNFAFPFQDGVDTLVVSFRDEIAGVREACPVRGPNFLSQTTDIRVPPSASTMGDAVPGWGAEGCEAFEDWPAEEPKPPCVELRIIEADAEMGYVAPLSSLESATGGGSLPVRLVFGGGALEAPGEATCGSGCDGTTSSTRWVQWTAVPDGRYLVSWYARETPAAVLGAAEAIDPADAVTVFLRGVSGTPSLATVSGVGSETAEGDWERHWGVLSVPADSEVGVGVVVGGTGVDEFSMIDIAGIMLEPALEAMSAGPSTFWSTDAVLTHDEPVCQDSDGSTFRERAFTYGCEGVCPSGYGTTCDPGVRETRCYYELAFGLGSDGLEALAGRGGGGFAGGNYNYRIQDVAVNLVGTGIRDCSLAGAGSSVCYGAGNVAYSLYHGGPFPVRNARGELYLAPLFPGRIESARSLAVERYITNPISSADRALIDPYRRIELRGRPLGGLFTLRIWNDDGLVFANLEDVQLVLSYRYWTSQR